MEKMGWKKGEGLGRDSNGMTSCLVLKKADGSTSQGRIEQAAPMPATQVVPTNGLPPGADAASQVPSALRAVPGDPLGSSIIASLAAAEAAASRGDAEAEQPKKRRKHGFDSEPTDDQGTSVVESTVMVSDAEVRMPDEADFIIAAARAAADIQMMGLNGQLPLPEPQAFTASTDVCYVVGNKSGNTLAGTPSANPGYGGGVSVGGVALGPGCGGPFPSNRKRIRQYVIDDWRWSKGSDAMRHFEEVTLPPGLVDMAKQVLGKESRYPARITDDTDCVVEVTAWGTLLVRPRGSGAHIALAKRMIYQVLHPQAGPLRNEALIEEDAEHEAAIRDFTTISQMEGRDRETELETMVERSAKNKLSKVGLGGDAPNEENQQVTRREIPLPTVHDISLARKNLNNLRLVTGVQALMNGASLVVVGQDAQVAKAEELVAVLVETGQWVTLNDNFVLSEETKEKRRMEDGPSEQLLIKIPEGTVVQVIQLHLAVMEKAAEAEKLKLTSKAVNGKRTLMVDGHRKAHERIKLMVREISEKGESPMLSKALGIKTETPAESKPAQSKAELASALASSLGVEEVKPKPAIVSSKPLAGGGIRNLPAPKLATQMARGDDLFADLPAPGGEVTPALKPAVEAPAQAPAPAPEVPPAFPPAAPAKPTVLRASDIFGAPAGARGVVASVAAKQSASAQSAANAAAASGGNQPTSLIAGLLATPQADSKEALAAQAASDAAEQELLSFYNVHAAAIAAPVTE